MANNELLTLNEIFNNKLFRIPDYQRGYAWESTQIEDFWEDIMNIKPGGKHYTGLLTVEAIADELVKRNDQWKGDRWLLDKGYKAYYIIDGQQRLTTSIILLNAILDTFEEDDDIIYDRKEKWQEQFLYKNYRDKFESFIFGYETDNPSNEFFKTKVLGKKSLKADKVPVDTLYTMNLMNAKNLFNQKLIGMEKADVENVFHKVANGLKFNFYEIDDELDVYVTFETMNNRGKPLSKLELLKNRLIYLTTLLNEDEQSRDKLRSDINEVWKTIYEYLGKNVKNTLDDDTFLKNHWIMYFKYDRKKANAFSEFLLNDFFIAKRVLSSQDDEKIGYKEISDYILSLSSSIKIWFYMHNPDEIEASDSIKEALLKHNRLGWGAFEPLLLAYMNKENWDEYNALRLLECTESFVFLVFSISRRQSYTQNNNFYRMASALNYDKMSIEDVISEIQNLIYYETEDYWDGWLDVDRFRDYISEQFKKENGYYSWNGLKYFLYEYEISLQEKNRESLKVTWETVKNQNSIEHIYPQNDSKEYWQERFKDLTTKQKHRLLNSLGNLLLLSQTKNSKLQNAGFDKKKNSYKFGSHSEIEVALCHEWNPQSILERGLKILKFMEYRWDIEIEDKIKLLGLEFLVQD